MNKKMRKFQVVVSDSMTVEVDEDEWQEYKEDYKSIKDYAIEDAFEAGILSWPDIKVEEIS